MRLLTTLTNQPQAQALSDLLTKRGIENVLESEVNDDWASSGYGERTFKIWVIDEDSFDRASQIAREPLAQEYSPESLPKKIPLVDFASQSFLKQPQEAEKAKPSVPVQSMGSLTFYLLLLCTLLFFISNFTAPSISTLPSSLPALPFVMPTIEKELLFDYPQAYEILDSIVKAYGLQSIQNPSNLPESGVALLEKFYHTPYWQGFYNLFMDAKGPAKIEAPLFEKIRSGEVWRLFTPALLHGNFLHLMFNMLWLAVLGKQLEHRLGKFRYILFILIAGILSNTAQYLMSGSNFLGFSGVLMGMLAFVWVRRRQAAWEGYYLQPGTLGFISFFILLTTAVQIFSFTAQYFYNVQFSLVFANTAHLTGALVGYLLGQLKFFAWKIT